jgi:hypothetical protein
MFRTINNVGLFLPELQYAISYFASSIQLAIFIYTIWSDNRIIFGAGDDDDDHAHDDSLSEG